MCGLFGMVGTLEYKHKKALKDLAFLTTLRGRDSTGVSAVHRNKQVSTRKMCVPGYEFVEHPAVDKALEYNDQLWIGHCRAKTQGDVSRANAHPFEVLDEEDEYIMLIGAHNGTLQNKYEVEREIKDKFDTDSEGIFNLLYKAKDYKSAIGVLRGAWSLTWWNPLEDKLYFCRNAERPLVFAFSEDRKVMIWASEAWMLLAACNRNDIKLAPAGEGKFVWGTLPDHLYSMEIPQDKDKVLPELKRESGYEGAKAYGARFQGNGGFGAWWDGIHGGADDDPEDNLRYVRAKPKTEQETGQKTEEKRSSTGKIETKIVDIDLFDPKTHTRGYNGEVITRQELEECKKAGCIWNGCKIGNVYGFFDEKSLICGDCLHDKHPKGVLLTGVQEDPLDDELPPFSTSSSENSEEYKELMAQAVKKSVG